MFESRNILMDIYTEREYKKRGEKSDSDSERIM